MLEGSSNVVGLSNESQDIMINPYMSENTIISLIVLLSAVIFFVGFVSTVPWHYFWRSHESQTAASLPNTGLKKKSIKSLPFIVYSKLRPEIQGRECPICLTDFMNGERVRVLPNCEHSFHMECVDKWFVSHSSCPTCRHCLLHRTAHVLGTKGSTEYFHPRELRDMETGIT
ncbi:hypothetical protein SUGI_0796540 [Cryptomeria japonica]|uniref:RING-H2 finger protein ATL74 n=1 Tax=Cryptomeria japonica TaxID=3369 RepID=UPI002414876B|nr:RING-H2 finger protein ATL74 [Cryptomeria japonica]GLJ39075.1 hypothetical protein SUGI_0796540 [Cryptomeria japonica]